MRMHMKNSHRAHRRGFSLVEILVALTITATLLTATLGALDASFKGYKFITESASNNVVARIVVQRTTAMIRNGTNFGPYPDDVLDSTQNPLQSTFIEFETARNDAAGTYQIVRIERRAATVAANGPYEAWYVLNNYLGGTLSNQDARPLISNLQAFNFTLEYDVGPRLKAATMDMTVNPTGLRDSMISTDIASNSVRMVTSVVPRKLD